MSQYLRSNWWKISILVTCVVLATVTSNWSALIAWVGVGICEYHLFLFSDLQARMDRLALYAHQVAEERIDVSKAAVGIWRDEFGRTLVIKPMGTFTVDHAESRNVH